MKYNTQFFIDFYSRIPEENWCTGVFTLGNNEHCAIGHIAPGSWAGTMCPRRSEKRVLYDLNHIMKGIKVNCQIKNGPTLIFQAGEDVNIPNSQSGLSRLMNINDGHALEYSQPTPKERVLAALRDAQAYWEGEMAVREAKAIVSRPRPSRNILVTALIILFITIFAASCTTQRGGTGCHATRGMAGYR